MATPLADQLFNPDGVAGLASSIHRAWPRFPAGRFTEQVTGRLMDLKLKERIDWIAQCLTESLPGDFRQATTILLQALPEPCDQTLTDDDFGDFIYAPLGAYVAAHGCSAADVEFSLEALRQITTRFSAEDAVRPFINAFPDLTLATMLAWTADEHYHVRRLASEGTRPLLPWARRLTVPAIAGLPILDRLAADPTRYVTRSVANHLNDIAKLDAELVVDTLARWGGESRHDPIELAFITRHATRTLVKQGHPGALALLGIRQDVEVKATSFEVPDQIALGDSLELAAELAASVDCEAIVDYAILFQDARGRLSRRRVFKLSRLMLTAASPVALRKTHRLRADRTTYRLYPGDHRVELLVNGRVIAERDFVISGR